MKAERNQSTNMPMVQRKEWSEFRETGLFLLMNQFLHIFGWAIVVEISFDGKVKASYPARVRFRGFDEKSSSAAYCKVAEYMVTNAKALQEEACGDQEDMDAPMSLQNINK